MTRVLSLLLATAAASISALAEVPVSAPRSVAADGIQTNPSVTAGDGMFLVVWEHATNRRELYGARVSNAGELLDVQPIPIAIHPRDGHAARVAWAGDRFLVLWRSSDGTHLTAISRDGEVIGDRNLALPAPQSLTCHRNGCLVVFAQPSGPDTSLYAARLSIDGQILEQGRRITTFAGTAQTVTATNGTNFLVAWYQFSPDFGQHRERLYTCVVGPSGAPASPRLVASYQFGLGLPAIASDGSGYLVAFGTTAVVVQRMNAAGDPIGEVTTALASSVSGSGASVIHSGNAYLVMTFSRRAPLAIIGIRINSVGTLLDSMPRALVEVSPNTFFAAAAMGPVPFIVWTKSAVNGSDIYGDLVSDIALTAPSRVLITRGAPGQREPSLSSDSKSILVAWNETAGDESDIGVTVFANDGTPAGHWLLSETKQAGSPPVAASNGSEYLVAWAETVPYTSRRIVARRMTEAGPVQELLELSATACHSGSPAVASNGRDFLVAWNDCSAGLSQMHAVRITDDGPLAPFPLTASSKHSVTSGDIAANDEQYLVTWLQSEILPVMCDPACMSNTVRAVRIGSGGSVLDAEPFVISAADPNAAPYSFLNSLRAVWTGEKFVVAWIGYRAIYAADVRTAGLPTRPRRIVNAQSFELDMAPTANGLALIWRQPDGFASEIYAARVAHEATEPAVGIPLAVIEPGSSPVVITPDGRSLLVAYSRRAYEPAYSGASRGFIRRLPATDRRRAVRR